MCLVRSVSYVSGRSPELDFIDLPRIRSFHSGAIAPEIPHFDFKSTLPSSSLSISENSKRGTYRMRISNREPGSVKHGKYLLAVLMF